MLGSPLSNDPLIITMPFSLYLLIAAQAVMMTGTSMVITSSALVGAMLAPDPSLATVPFGMQFLGMAVTTYPASMIMARLGRRLGFILGAGVGLCGALLCTYGVLELSMAWFTVGSFLVGSFNGVAQYYRFAAADIAPEGDSARAISWVVTGGIAAAFIGPNLARFTLNIWPGHQFAGVFATLVGLMTLSGLVVAMLKVPAPSSDVRHSSGRSLFKIISQRIYIVAALSATIGYGVMNLLMSATPLAMKFTGHPFDDTAFVIQWHIVAMFAPGFFTGTLIARYGVGRVILAGSVLMLGTVVVNLTGTGFWQFWAALVLLGVGWNFLFVSGTYLLTQSYEPGEKAKAQGINDLLIFSTVTITALSSGAIHYWAGWDSVNFGVLPFLAVVLMAVAWYQHGIKQERAKPA
jgi:MFS family permease